MKTIIIGKNGFIAKQLAQRNKSFIFTTRDKSDVASLYLELENINKFDFSVIDSNTNVVFLAAISSPDECVNNYNYSYKINVIGTKSFIAKFLSKGAKVLFFSSDVIYGNTTGRVDENSNINPFGNYAQMKNEVEKYFEQEKNFKVFRLSYILSQEDKYLSYLRDCLKQNKVAEVFHPFSRKVIYINDALEAIESILEKWDEFNNQKFNICGEENISRKDMADFYNSTIGNTLNYKIIEPNKDFWEARPQSINIYSIYLEKLLTHKPTKIQNAIKNMIKNEK